MQGSPKLHVAIIGCGLAGLSTAVELLDAGYSVEIFDQRPFIGGKVASWQDKDGNHIEVRRPPFQQHSGLPHVFTCPLYSMLSTELPQIPSQ